MPVSFVHATTAYVDSGTSVVIDKPTGLVAGDFIIAVVLANSASTPPSGFTPMGGGELGGQFYWKLAGGSEPSTYTWSFAGGASTHHVGYAAYRGLRRADPIRDYGYTEQRVFGFSDDIIFNNATVNGVAQRPGMLFVAAVATYHNGSSPNYAWPPAGMNSRIHAGSGNTKAWISLADKLDQNAPISSQTPGNITYTHSGGTFQDWNSFTMFHNRQHNPQTVI